MNIKEVHYNIKRKINKVDSQQYRNLLVPEIDAAINEAIELFIDLVAKPRNKSFKGFEKNQKSTDDIRTLVVTDHSSDVSFLDNIEIPYYLLEYPGDYKYFVRGRTIISKGECKEKIGKFRPHEHDDEHLNSAFDKPSFEWRMVNAEFSSDGIHLYTDGTFVIDKVLISYIKKHPYVHNAEDFRVGGYKLPSGELLTGTQEILLPEHTHREIVDLAAMIISNDINSANYQFKVENLKLNNLL